MEQGYSKTVKALGVALIILSVIMLFTPWMATTGESEYDYSDYYDEMESIVDEIQYYAAWLGIDFDSRDVNVVLNCVMDGKLSPYECFVVAGKISGPCSKLGQSGYLSDDDSRALMEISFALHAHNILFIVTLLSAVLAIIYRVTGKYKKYGCDILLFIFELILLFVYLWLIATIGKEDIHLRITLTSILACVFDVPMSWLKALPLEKLPDISGGVGGRVTDTVGATVNEAKAVYAKIKDMDVPIISSWTCPQCGTSNSFNSGFCTECGCVRPTARQCPSCGTKANQKDKFCKKCGTKLEPQAVKETTPVVFPQSVEAAGKVCPRCGSRNSQDSLFCEYCGGRLNG